MDNNIMDKKSNKKSVKLINLNPNGKYCNYDYSDEDLINKYKKIKNITYEIIDDQVLYENSNDTISNCESYSIFIIKLK